MSEGDHASEAPQAMPYITLGIIGHVDHGKTALVKSLTGVLTDRLKEEQERGISIVLGYSHLDTPGGEIGIVDVPGHERFIRTMVSGATAIEAVLLVVDVNEGVKPQTIEHIEIAEMLGVKKGVIAVTKCDVALPDRREETLEELEILVDETFLEGAPVVFTSSVSLEGFEELKERLSRIVADSVTLRDEGYFYLPVDRVFSMPGFGTVLTGTLRRGAISVGDEVEIYPGDVRGKVRELQSHNEFTEKAPPGHRTAVNLRGIEKSQINRGDVLATPGSLAPTNILDVELTLLKSAGGPLKNNQHVRLLYGTVETFARVHLIDRDHLERGKTCVAQLRNPEKMAALNQEHFIIRTYSPMRTIGGGRILGVSRKGYRRYNEASIRRLKALAEGDARKIIVEELIAAGAGILSIRALSLNLREEIEGMLADLPVTRIGEDGIVLSETFEAWRSKVVKSVAEFHKKERTVKGIVHTQLHVECASEIGEELFEAVLESLVSEKRIAIEEGLVHTAGFDPTNALSDGDRAVAEDIEKAFKKGALKPPDLEEVLGGDKERMRIYRYLVDKQVLVATLKDPKVRSAKNTIAFHREALKSAQELLVGKFAPPAQFSMSEAKDTLETSRKFAIPLLEYFDSQGFTRRSGDHRVIVGSAG